MESREESESILEEPTADLKDPAEALMPAADKAVLTQPAMTDLEAALTTPLVVINREMTFLDCMRAADNNRSLRTQKTGSNRELEGFWFSFQPD